MQLRLRSLLRRHAVETELDDELRDHIARKTALYMARGTDPGNARRQALLDLGGAEQVKEICRDQRRVAWLQDLLGDARYGSRQLRRSPGFAAAAVITLALGIGATTAIFSVVNGVLLEALPYPESNQLVSLRQRSPNTIGPVSYPNFFDWQAQNHVFTAMATYHGSPFTLTGEGQAVHVEASIVSSSLFQVLRANPLLARTFEPQDDRAGANAVVVLSYPFWRQVFHSNRSIVGRSITLDNHTFTVVGVMPPGFEFPPDSREDLWTSMAADRESGSNIMTGRGFCSLGVVARLKPGVNPTEARADMDVIARRLATAYPQYDAGQTSVDISPEIDSVVGDAGLELLTLLGVVGGVLLIACVNVASLSLARNLGRRKEVALRAALGAQRSRVFRQFLTESVSLALLGGATGMILAVWGTKGLVALASKVLPRMANVGMDWRVLAFGAALSLLTGIVFGLAPALQASHTNLVDSLKEAARSLSPGASPRRLRSALVVVETALALMLLIGAGLLISSYLRLTRVNPGFNPDSLLTFHLDLPAPPYTDAATLRFLDTALLRLRALPGVQDAASGWNSPFAGGDSYAGFEIEGRRYPSGDTPSARADAVTPGYFRTMGIPLLRGRTFNAQDDATGSPVIIVNQAFAQQYFPGESALGKRIQPGVSKGGGTPWREIIGVVGNVKQLSLAESFAPEYYLPVAQLALFGTVVVRTTGDPLRMVSAVRATIASLDKNVPLYDVRPMDDHLSATVAENRLNTMLLGLFGALALLLAALGIYGVVSYTVSQSRHEIGIRMALGAERGDVLIHVLAQGLKLALIGTAMGISGAFAATRYLASFLYAVNPTDPATFAAAALVLVGAALLASYIPARRATRIDPVVALRNE